MKNRFRIVLGGLLLAGWAGTSFAADNKIHAFLTESGRVLFTNGVENAPAPVPAATFSVSADPIHALIETISGLNGVDPALVKAMIKTESNFNRWAISSKGARGLMQLIPETGVRFGVRDFFDPKQNIEGGVRYIKFLLEKFKGDLDLSLAAYNAGENLVERLGRIPSIPETRDYVRKVRSSYGKSTAPTALSKVAAVSPTPEAPPVQQIFRTVDERGVIHFSNIAPPK